MSAALSKGAVAFVGPAVCLAVGVGIAANPQVGFVLAAGAIGACALAAPTAAWVGAALVAALTFKGLATVGAVPSVATYLDIPLAWGALAVALLRRREASPLAVSLVRALVALVFAVFVSWVFHRSEVLRPILHVALLAEPFALVAAMLLDPPSARARVWLIRVAAALFVIQIPLLYGQYALLGGSDRMQGTLYGAGAGSHTIAAVVLIGALWMMGRSSGAIIWKRIALLVPVLALPILADAKQVVIAAPAMALAWTRGASSLAWLLRGSAVAASTAALFFLAPGGGAVVSFLERAQSNQIGKVEAARFVWSEMSSDPASIAFGKGPAETVSRAAFMTLPTFRREDSPLEVLGLHPARIAKEAQGRSLVASGGGTSFNSGVSSAIGIFGDLGLFGAAAYCILLWTLARALYRHGGHLGLTALGGWSLFLVLGFIFDWWEQPPFTLFLAVLTGLALTGPAGVDVARSAAGRRR